MEHFEEIMTELKSIKTILTDPGDNNNKLLTSRVDALEKTVQSFINESKSKFKKYDALINKLYDCFTLELLDTKPLSDGILSKEEINEMIQNLSRGVNIK